MAQGRAGDGALRVAPRGRAVEAHDGDEPELARGHDCSSPDLYFRARTTLMATLRIRLQAESYPLSLKCLYPGSGRKIPTK